MQVYLDNAATTKMSKTAIAAMLPYLDAVYANPSSSHSAGQRANAALCAARAKLASQLGCQAREITFTSGGTEADNQAILSAARMGERCGKKHIVSTAFEHHAVLHTLNRLEKEGFAVSLLDVPQNGVLAPDQVANALRPDTCLVTVMFANNEIGTVQPVGEIGRLCRERGVLFHTDAVQAAGQLPIDVERQNIDLLSLSAHKFHGPKGVGALYARKGVALVPILEGGAQERGKRAGTENLPAIAGMAAALAEACAHMEENAKKITALRDQLIAGLSAIPGAALNGDAQKRLPGNVNFSFAGVEGEMLLLLLDAAGICASAGSACTAGALAPSHVLLAIGKTREAAQGALRLTLSAENTAEEVAYTVKAVAAAVEKLRSASQRG